jgi:hypothetical protein
VSPSPPRVSSTNHWFSQHRDVSGPIQLGPCANSTGRSSGQVNSYIHLRSQSLYSNCSSTSESEYAMEPSIKNTLLSDIEPMCETQVISHASVSHQYPIKWMLDSGASAHFTSLEDFSSIQMGFFSMVQTASLPQTIRGCGTILIKHLIVDTETRAESSHQTKLWPVFYVEGLHMQLISTGQLLWSI